MMQVVCLAPRYANQRQNMYAIMSAYGFVHYKSLPAACCTFLGWSSEYHTFAVEFVDI
jgi:hypothetical protein